MRVSVIFRYELHYFSGESEVARPAATYDFPRDGNRLLHVSDRCLQTHKLIDIVTCRRRLNCSGSRCTRREHCSHGPCTSRQKFMQASWLQNNCADSFYAFGFLWPRGQVAARARASGGLTRNRAVYESLRRQLARSRSLQCHLNTPFK